MSPRSVPGFAPPDPAIERAITRDRADFLTGGFRSEAVLAMQEVAMDNKKIFLGAGASLTKLGANVEENYNRYKYWFRVSPTKDTDLIRTVFTVLGDRKSTRLNSSHMSESRMPSSA